MGVTHGEIDRDGYRTGTSVTPNEKEKREKPLAPRAFSNSRGGTRTLDPGIMSAVL